MSPAAWTAQQHPLLQGQPVDISQWWHTFNDPALDQLVQCALEGNVELQEAGRRILEVRALRNVAAGNLYPQQQTVNGSFSNTLISENTANFVTVPGFFETDRDFDTWGGNFGLAWELDFWGRLRRTVEAADARLEQTIAAYDFVRVVLLAELARNYIEMRSIEARMLLVQQQISVQQTLVRLAEQRLQEGLGNRLDLEQTKSNLHLIEYELPGLETFRRQACHRICVLTGSLPTDLQQVLGNTGQIPSPGNAVAVGIPADLLRRRPDIHVAERELAAQSARIGIAQAELYPHISLIGQIGLQSEDLNDLFQPGSLVRNVGPGFSWNILNYGRLKNQVQSEREAFARLLHAYQQTVLTAYQEAEDAQVSFVNGYSRLHAIHRACQASQEASQIGLASYAEGAANLDRVLQLQRDHLRAETEKATVQADIALALVKVYLAVGGGWNAPGVACFPATVRTSPATMVSQVPQAAQAAIQPALPTAPHSAVATGQAPHRAVVAQPVTYRRNYPPGYAPVSPQSIPNSRPRSW